MSLFMDGSETLGSAIFGHAELGDRRRTARLVKTFDQLCRHPGGTFPDKLATPRDLKALYRLMKRPEVTHEALLASLRVYTFRQPCAWGCDEFRFTQETGMGFCPLVVAGRFRQDRDDKREGVEGHPGKQGLRRGGQGGAVTPARIDVTSNSCSTSAVGGEKPTNKRLEGKDAPAPVRETPDTQGWRDVNRDMSKGIVSMRKQALFVALAAVIVALFATVAVVRAADTAKAVKVFILAGQSNMEGKAANSLLDYQAEAPGTRDLYKHLRKDGKWIVRDDVFVKFFDRKGPLTIGYGSPGATGVELEFGTLMGDHFQEPVLLIKAAWGGHSLYQSFRSPSAGYPMARLQAELENRQKHVKQNNEKNQRNDPLPTMDDIKKTFGPSYRAMLSEVKETFDNYETLFPALNGRKLELAGFVWFQGWNDMNAGGMDKEYASNMKHFIEDVRKDLGAPKLPFVIAAMGQNGSNPADGDLLTIREAQMSMNDVPEFKGNVKAFRTDLLVDKEAELLIDGWEQHKEEWNKVGSNWGYHYLGSAIWFNRIGKTMGEAMLGLMSATASGEEAVILTPKPPAAPRINGPKVYGCSPGHPFLYRIPCTGVRPMTFAAEGLPGSLKLDSATGIITGTAPERGEYKVTFTAKNQHGQSERVFKIVAGDKLSLTPQMGFNDWYAYYNRVTDLDMRAAADIMIAKGMADVGYQYVNLDDCWMGKRDAAGNITGNEKFPDMKALADYIHSKGLKAGLYTSPGPRTCAGYAGAWKHEAQDAKQFADWGYDFLKYDWCSYGEVAGGKDLAALQKPYRLMSQLLKQQNRDIVLNLCQYGMGDVWSWGGDVGGHSWRTGGDLGYELNRIFEIALKNCTIRKHNKPGEWNDPDYIQIGWIGDANGMGKARPAPLTPNESYSFMSLWCLMAAPLFYSGDMTKLDDFTLNVLCNSEVIDVDQDPLGECARIVGENAKTFVLVKNMEDGTKAVGLFNRGNSVVPVTVKWSDLGIVGKQIVRDLWRQKDLGGFENQFSAPVGRRGVMMLRIRPCPATAALR